VCPENRLKKTERDTPVAIKVQISCFIKIARILPMIASSLRVWAGVVKLHSAIYGFFDIAIVKGRLGFSQLAIRLD
jgi:hypothetical protein